MDKLKGKKKIQEMWKRGLFTWEEWRNVVRACRDAVRKAKAHLEFNLAKEVKDNKKSFFACVSSKNKTMENVGLLLSEVAAVVTGDAEEAEIQNAFLASVITTKTASRESQGLEVREGDWEMEKKRHMSSWASQLYFSCF